MLQDASPFPPALFRGHNRLAGVTIAAFIIVATAILLLPASKSSPADEPAATAGPGLIAEVLTAAQQTNDDDGHDHSHAMAPAPASDVATPEPVIEAAGSDAPLANSIILWGWESWDAVSLANVQQAISLLPQSVQAQLGNPALGPAKVLVNFEGRTASGYQPYGRAANFFSTNEYTNEVVLYPQQSVFTVLHELGHAYNLRYSAAGNYAGVLSEPEMQSFMAVAGWQVLASPEHIAAIVDHSQVAVAYSGAPIWPSMSRNDPLEDFANSFAEYFSNPESLAVRSPERYAWFAERFAF